MPSALIVTCSAAKRSPKGPAINVYNGPMFRVLRKWQPNIKLFILSAWYGFIDAGQEIETYDQVMPRRPGPEYMNKLATQISESKLVEYGPIYVCMGDLYMNVWHEATRMVYIEKYGNDSITYPGWIRDCVIFLPAAAHQRAKGRSAYMKALSEFCREFPYKGDPEWAKYIEAYESS